MVFIGSWQWFQDSQLLGTYYAIGILPSYVKNFSCSSQVSHTAVWNSQHQPTELPISRLKDLHNWQSLTEEERVSMKETAIPQRLLRLAERFQFHSTGGITVAFVMEVTPWWEHPDKLPRNDVFHLLPTSASQLAGVMWVAGRATCVSHMYGEASGHGRKTSQVKGTLATLLRYLKWHIFSFLRFLSEKETTVLFILISQDFSDGAMNVESLYVYKMFYMALKEDFH